MSSMDEFRTRGFIPSSKIRRPGSGAQDTIFEPDADLYRVDVKHIMAWEYGTVANCTDWKLKRKAVHRMGKRILQYSQR